MKKHKHFLFCAVLLLCGALLLGAAGCGKAEMPEDSSIPVADATGSSSADSTTTTEDTTTTTTTETTTTTTTTTVPSGSFTTRPSSTTTTWICNIKGQTTTRITSVTTRTTTTTATTTTTTTQPPQPEVETLRNPPKLVRQTEGYDSKYYKVIRTEEGKIVAVGSVNFADNTPSGGAIIDVYDDNFVLQQSRIDWNWCVDIIACRDGGFLVVALDYAVQKLSSDLTTEWNLSLIDPAKHFGVSSMAQLSDGTLAVLYHTYNEAIPGHGWYLALLTEDGQILEQKDLCIRQADCEDPTLLADKDGGYYLVIGIGQKDVGSPEMIQQARDTQKGREVAIAHYAPDGDSWSIDSVQTLGGLGDDWCEEATIDEEGNFYIAIGSRDTIPDPFWDEVTPRYFYRRMLVKVTPTGEVVCRVPLSGRSLAVDQVSGIHVQDGRVYVTGMSAYYDGVLNPYLPDAWLDGDAYSLYVAYAATFDTAGNLLSRFAFQYNHVELGEPGESVLLPDGRILFCGAVCEMDSDFDLDFNEDYNGRTPTDRALFIY